MNRTVRVFAVSVALLAALAAPSSAAGNREANTLSIAPDPGGGTGWVVTGYWTLSVEPESVPEDFSTDVQVCVDGIVVDEISVPIMVDPGSGGTCPAAPPCSGVCGSATIDGVPEALLCIEDEGVCDCGIPIVTEFPPLDLSSGENVAVKVLAKAGAVPDNDDSDNGVDKVFPGFTIGWNREVEEVELVAVGPGLYDVTVDVSLQWLGHPAPRDLSSVLALIIDGTEVELGGFIAEATEVSPCACVTLGCGSPCGTLNGNPATCKVFEVWNCGCGETVPVTFDDIAMGEGAEVRVLVNPAPGALPELPGLDDDDTATFICCDGAVGVGAGVPAPIDLKQNYPNPFNPLTEIAFEISSAGRTSLTILDTAGRVVATLLDTPRTAGEWTVTWDGTSDDGVDVASGIYFYRLSTPDGVQTRRMALVK